MYRFTTIIQRPFGTENICSEESRKLVGEKREKVYLPCHQAPISAPVQHLWKWDLLLKGDLQGGPPLAHANSPLCKLEMLPLSLLCLPAEMMFHWHPVYYDMNGAPLDVVPLCCVPQPCHPITVKHLCMHHNMPDSVYFHKHKCCP